MRKKPLIIYDQSNDPRGRSYRDNINQQNLLFKGMLLKPSLVGAAEYAGIKRTVDLYQTMDRLALRKDLHLALSDEGIDLRYIVKGIKGLADGAELDSVRLESYKTFLRALGLDKFVKDEEGSKGWEDAVAGYIKKKEIADASLTALEVPKDGGYQVTAPKIPESAQKARKAEETLGKELYEH
jgi:hypothetical protein